MADYHGDIEIELFVDRLSDNFLMSPNDLHRGRGDWSGLTLRARALLAALLTMRSGWRISRKTIDDMAPELGRKGVSTVLRELRERGFIETAKINGEDGKFTWCWRIHLHPTSVGPSGDDGDPTTGPSGDDGHDQGKHPVSPGRTIGPSAIDGQGDLLRRPCLSEELEEPPHPPRDDRSAPTAVKATTGGDPPENPDPEDEAITDAIGHQPTWRPIAVRAAIRQAVSNGLDPESAYQAIVDLAEGTRYGPTTAGPQRILARGPWWTPGSTFIAAPPRSQANTCRHHPGQLAGSCSCCGGERLGRPPTAPTIPPASIAPEKARDLFAAIPCLRRAPAA